jgi:hypothetical protein
MEDYVDAMDTNGTTTLRHEENTYLEDNAPWTDNTLACADSTRLRTEEGSGLKY